MLSCNIKSPPPLILSSTGGLNKKSPPLPAPMPTRRCSSTSSQRRVQKTIACQVRGDRRRRRTGEDLCVCLTLINKTRSDGVCAYLSVLQKRISKGYPCPVLEPLKIKYLSPCICAYLPVNVSVYLSVCHLPLFGLAIYVCVGVFVSTGPLFHSVIHLV